MASKYDPLGAYLRAQGMDEAPMSFADIETVIGAALPPKAVNHPAWWSNNTSNNTMTKVWLDAGFRTERVDIAGRKLVFRRVSDPTRSGLEEAQPGPFSAPGSPPAWTPTRAEGGLRERMRAALGGTVTVAQGVSLTAPSGEAWAAEGP
jgi:hypothetical protein